MSITTQSMRTLQNNIIADHQRIAMSNEVYYDLTQQVRVCVHPIEDGQRDFDISYQFVGTCSEVNIFIFGYFCSSHWANESMLIYGTSALASFFNLEPIINSPTLFCQVTNSSIQIW